MARISDDTILQVQRAVDIYEVVSSYLPLKRSGANYKGLCPFHDEKSPSFMVHPERQIFKCFGCQKGGSVFTFVMNMEKVGFPEAVEMLAGKAGIAIKTADGRSEGPDRNELYRVMEWAAKHFHRLLMVNPEGAAAREYAAKRKLTRETLEGWQIGCSPDRWDDLLVSATRNGFSESQLRAAGLVMQRESGGSYDRFRNRLMFPIQDAQGRVVGFGGRILGDGEPKYLNSPETALFSKSRLLYGLGRARDYAATRRTLHIVEGYMDVVLPAQHGVEGLVATLGTALTREHLGMLRRHADRVVLVFDSDEAGRRATERSLDLLLEENLDLYVATIPGAKDPADFVLQEGPDSLREHLDKPVEIFHFLTETLEARIGMQTPAQKARVVGELMERVGQIQDSIKQSVFVQRIASRYGVPESALYARLSERAEGARRATPAVRPVAEEPEPDEASESIGRELIEILVHSPACLEEFRDQLPLERFPTAGTRKVALKMYELRDREGTVDPGALASLIQEEDAMAVVADVLSREPQPEDQRRKRLKGCLEFLESIDYRRTVLEERARRAGGSAEELDESLRRLQQARGLRNARGVPRPSA